MFFAAYVGPSMNPTLREPEIMEIRPYESRPLRVGDVAFFLPAEADQPVVHRIIRVTPAGISTLGDNNTQEDTLLLQPKSIKGQVVAAWRGQKRRKIAGGYQGRLTLNGSSTDTWIFKIGTSGGALTATDFSVVMPGGETCNNNVFWWVADAATLTRSFFIGSILAGASITVTGGSLDGQALAKDAVTLTDTDVAVCGTPSYPSIMVTGGGQIPVPDPVSTGRATFGFNAQPDKSGGAKGNFNYVNYVTGLHVNGAVTSIQVIAVNPDGSPKTIRFSGTCGGMCSFSVTVEDHGEPGTNDEFGIRVTGGPTEVKSQRVISQGNIQFHK